MQDLKPQRAVESDSSWHFVGAQCDRADPLDHGQNSPVLFPAPFVVDTSPPSRAHAPLSDTSITRPLTKWSAIINAAPYRMTGVRHRDDASEMPGTMSAGRFALVTASSVVRGEIGSA